MKSDGTSTSFIVLLCFKKKFKNMFRFRTRKTLNEISMTGRSLLFFQKIFLADRPIKPFPFLTDEYL